MREVWLGFRGLFIKKKAKLVVLVTSFCLSLAAALLEGSSFGFILYAFRSLENQALSSMDFIFKRLVPSSFEFSLSAEALFIACIMLAVFFQIIKSGFNLCSQFLLAKINNELQIYLQKKIYSQVMALSFSCASRYKVGDLVEYAKAPSTTVHSILDSLNKSLTAFLSIIALLGVMFFLSPSLTTLAVLIFGVLGILQKYIIILITRESNRLVECLTLFSSDMVQVLHGLRAIFTFDRQKEILHKTSSLLYRIAELSKKTAFLNNAIPFINEVTGISLVGIFLVVGYLLGGDKGSLPVLLTFVTVAYRLNGKVQQLFSCVGQIANCWGHVKRIEDILRTDDKEFTKEEGKFFDRFNHSITLNHITLYYPGRKIPAIKNLSFEISKKTVIAFVGLSGAGKSSVLDLLLRLYEPSEGQILVDGTPITHFNISSWRQIFGVVSQDIFIFNDTIENNIRFGKTDVSHESVVKYARLAGADEFISKMPQQYQTLVGERGYRLSGGERQRLSLARALLRNPQILILDEATSNLDSKSELLIKQALNQLRKEKTLIIVAHRLSTIMHADQIIVMEHGQIKESGSHHQLLATNGLYSSLWEIQSQEAPSVGSV